MADDRSVAVEKTENSFLTVPNCVPYDAIAQQVYTEQADHSASKRTAELEAVHPLHGTWTMWYLEYEQCKNWGEMQNEITNISTVEDFWRLYMAFKPPSQIRVGSDLSLFRKGIRPMWEDPANKEGGRWKISFYGKNRLDLDAVWLDICLLLIGEVLEHSQNITGAVVNVRGKINKISVWTGKFIRENELMALGKKLRDHLRLQESTLRFELHKNSMSPQGPTAVDSFIV